ncbi:MAG: hypothetical protein A2096_17185 [Spirochaetes bacterium GWF1_41_5]|nr:MAG: hypothetical protein A2096_17185 [Spirochaetes bacterium GWF1_41_5]
MPGNYESYLFDLDGTLLHSIDLIIKCFEYSLSYAAGISLPEQMIRRYIGLPLKKQFEIYLGHNKGLDYDDIMQKHMDFQLAHWKNYLYLYDGVIETLSALKNNNKKLALVTSRRENTVKIYTGHFQIDRFFEIIITPDNCSLHKPDPGPALAALHFLGTSAKHALFVGDAEFDILCGRSAGMKTCLVKYSHAGEIIEQPDFVIENLRELL